MWGATCDNDRDNGSETISIHAPRVGSDRLTQMFIKALPLFQSTLPVWGATIHAQHQTRQQDYFNPRSPCGERLRRNTAINARSLISIHAPRVGSDYISAGFGGYWTDFNPRSPCGERRCHVGRWDRGYVFQSTLPVWGATLRRADVSGPDGKISIHAPRVGSDACRPRSTWRPCIFQSTLPVWGATVPFMMASVMPSYFNPRSPCGERRLTDSVWAWHRDRFQSTLPVWGATMWRPWPQTPAGDFNPRSPCGERHGRPSHTGRCAPDFNPRSPCGERPCHGGFLRTAPGFQSTLPVWGATFYRINPAVCLPYFNPRSPCGERRKKHPRSQGPRDFNPRSPCGERLQLGYELAEMEQFQSTLPVWGATIETTGLDPQWNISIHAPRVGSDCCVHDL